MVKGQLKAAAQYGGASLKRKWWQRKNYLDEDAAIALAKKNREDVAFVLENPVYLEVSEPIRKMRGNLMIVSIVSIFSVAMGLGIGPTSSLSGVQFTGLTEAKISVGLLLITSYTLIHFGWSSWDGFQDWRMRCSGVRIAFHELATPVPNIDPRQLSLMNWWTCQAITVGRMQDSVQHCHDELEKALEQLKSKPTSREDDERKQRHEMIETFNGYASGMIQLYKMGVSVPNEKSLREQLARFELIFKRFQVSQNWRWIVIEFSTPVVLGLLAIGLLATDLNLNPLFNFAIV